MSEILTKAGQEVTHIDDARAYNFDAGNRSGIVKGAFNEGRFFASSNVIAFDSCELRIAGHRIVNDYTTSFTLANKPTTNERYSMVAELVVDDSSVPRVTFMIQNSSNPLRKDNLYKTAKGSGTYQLEIGRFTLTPAGTIIDVVRTVDVITGGGNGSLTDIEFNATAYDLDSNKQPEVNVDFNEETKKYDMNIGIPRGQNGLDGSGINPNLLINGDFRVNQRGQSVYGDANNTTTGYPSSIYSSDRWHFSRNYTGTFDVVNKILSTGTNGTYANISQILELDVTTLIGKNITFSVDVNVLSGRIQIIMGRIRNNSWTQVSGYSGFQTPNVLTRISNTMLITNDWLPTDKLYVTITVNGGNNYSAFVDNCKLEVSLVATAFSPRPYAEELALCQRYYINLSDTVFQLPAVCASGTDIIYAQLFLPTTLRTSPTITDIEGFSVRGDGTIIGDAESVSVNNMVSGGVRLKVQKAGLTNNALYCVMNCKCNLDAEIY